jgi:anhydro-N-acetylmuramic acid kinase
MQVIAVQAKTYPYSEAERAFIHSLFGRQDSARGLCEGSFRLGELFASLAQRFVAELGLDPTAIDLIGSHGQTVWHQPPTACRDNATATASTLQLGEPAILAARLGAITVADFRVADIALGGEGAPLVPFCDWLLFRRPGTVRALQNIGGIANVSVLADRAEQLLAFDNGPGNMLIDALAPAASAGRLHFDEDGQLSAAGRIQPDILATLLDDPYLRLPPPKSTGRERYGQRFAQALQARYPACTPLDLLATAVAFTAHAIANSLRPLGVEEVLVSGGGAHNRTLMAQLALLLKPAAVAPLHASGIDVDNKEAVAFALLAVSTVHGEVANLPSVTGARSGAILGKICFPPPGKR